MLRSFPTRIGVLVLPAALLVVALATTSCGGGSGGKATKPLSLVDFLFVDRSLTPAFPTGAQSLPRNAMIMMVFTERVDPSTVHDQTIQIRFGPTGQSVPKGSFSVDGNKVLFDPTVTAQGQPNPRGFDPVVQYSVDIPSIDDQDATVRSVAGKPNLSTFFTNFRTSDGWLRELVPPEWVAITGPNSHLGVGFQPAPNGLTKQIPGNGFLTLRFNEPMNEATFVLGGAEGPVPGTTTVDIRYLATEQINIDNNLVNAQGIGAEISGTFSFNAALTEASFHPTFSFGNKKFVFAVSIFQGVQDLAGNLLVNPRSIGPFTCDGTGAATGKVLREDFTNVGNQDFLTTSADWGLSEDGILQGQPISSRNALLLSYLFVKTVALGGSHDPQSGTVGAYFLTPDPMIGHSINNIPNIIVNPPSNQGRRVMWSYTDTEMGPGGTITAVGWGADSNASFAAIYPDIKLRCGYQKSNSLALGGSFSGNYKGTPVILYSGPYTVQQKANWGNTPGEPQYTHDSIAGYPCTGFVGNCNPTGASPCQWNAPLWFTGFAPWPDLTTFFEWDPGDPTVENDSIFLFDASCQEGDTFQLLRGWLAVTHPCSGFPQVGYPQRRLYSTYEEDTANPQSVPGQFINPGAEVQDMSFTVTTRVTMAQTLFYTDGTQPSNSAATTFGTASDYKAALLVPTVQSGGAQVKVEYQAAQAVEADRRTINPAFPFTPWAENHNVCDGYRNIRWRISLISNLISGQRARLREVAIPVLLQP